MKLHALPELDLIPDDIVADLHSWQLKGAAKMLHIARSKLKGEILADEWSLGKTLTTITTGRILGETNPGAFNLIIAPKSCVAQWYNELMTNLSPVSTYHFVRYIVTTNSDVVPES